MRRTLELFVIPPGKPAGAPPEPGPDVDTVLGNAVEALRIIAILVSPAVPATAQRIWERLGFDGAVHDQRVPNDVAWGAASGGRPIAKGDPLFPRIK